MAYLQVGTFIRREVQCKARNEGRQLVIMHESVKKRQRCGWRWESHNFARPASQQQACHKVSELAGHRSHLGRIAAAARAAQSCH